METLNSCYCGFVLNSFVFEYFCGCYSIMSISANIRSIRIQKGLKQKDVYAFLGIGKSVYSKIESEGREATVQELIKLSKLSMLLLLRSFIGSG